MAINTQDSIKNKFKNNSQIENINTLKNNNKRKFINLNEEENTNDNEQITMKKNKILLISISYDEAIYSNNSS